METITQLHTLLATPTLTPQERKEQLAKRRAVLATMGNPEQISKDAKAQALKLRKRLNQS